MTLLTALNYRHGFLISDDWLGGVADLRGGGFSAFVVDQKSGESVFYGEFESLEAALAQLNSCPFVWLYEASNECGGGKCGKGACGGASCPVTQGHACQNPDLPSPTDRIF